MINCINCLLVDWGEFAESEYCFGDLSQWSKLHRVYICTSWTQDHVIYRGLILVVELMTETMGKASGIVDVP